MAANMAHGTTTHTKHITNILITWSLNIYMNINI